MTLRGWSLLVILGVFAIILTAHAAHADSLWDEPTVWQQLSVHSVKAKVVKIEARGSSIVYKITTSDDTSSLQLCPGLAPESVNPIMLEAFRSGHDVILGMSGPMNACLVSASVSKGA
jgi:hypothetical protein